jgi:ankyrin repeat protein
MPDSRSLPARPSLRRLRQEAKSRTREGEFETLAEAHIEMAQEFGYGSWPLLKAFIDTRALDASKRAVALVRSACSGDLRTARVLLEAEPSLARHDLATACVTGEHEEVALRLARDPQSVSVALAPCGWQPLAYACFSRLLRADPQRAPGIVAVARILLEAGADPNVAWRSGDWLQLPIFGAAGVANSAELTRLLLDHDADANETLTEPNAIGESLYHAIEFPDLTCARLLLEAGTAPHKVSYCLWRAIDFPDPAKVELLLEYGAVADSALLHSAVFRGRPLRTVTALLDAGAPVDEPDQEGLTAMRIAVRWGRDDVERLLLDRGADPGAVTAEDREIGTVLTGGSKATAQADTNALPLPSASPAPSPSVPARVPPAALLDWASHSGDKAAVSRLLAAGAAVNGTQDAERPPLAQAAWRGHNEVVELLVAHGAKLLWGEGGSGVGAALHGARNCHHAEAGSTMQTEEEITHGDYGEVLRVLMVAGAPIPETLWDSFDVEGEFARLGAELPEGVVSPDRPARNDDL